MDRGWTQEFQNVLGTTSILLKVFPKHKPKGQVPECSWRKTGVRGEAWAWEDLQNS